MPTGLSRTVPGVVVAVDFKQSDWVLVKWPQNAPQRGPGTASGT